MELWQAILVAVGGNAALLLAIAIEERFKAWDGSWSKVKKDLPRLRSEMEHEFRKLLGVPSGAVA